jgi:TPP-dependent pyruvate/acetoin dehydrogenase alpha subunit
MSDLDRSKRLLDRREFLKMMGSAGATAVVMSAAAPAPLGQAAAAPAVAPEAAAPLADDAPPGMKAIYVYTEGPGNNRDWQAGDALKYLPPEKIPDGSAADLLASLPKDKLATIYRHMYTTRKWETALKDAWLNQECYGSYSLYIGEEAIASGVIGALNEDDYVLSTHRPGGHMISKNLDLNKLTAEIYLRETGYSKGKGARMHVAAPETGFLASNGIVGSSWYPAAGAAYSAMVRGSKQVAVAFGGEGATSSVYYFSAVRNAQLFKLPVVFVVENNFQQIMVYMATFVPTKQVCDYTKGLGVPSVTVDGNDVAAVYAAAQEAVDRARAGEGPSVIEAMTYRWYDHHGFAGAEVGVDGAWGIPYRTDEEVLGWMSRDPIARYKAFLLERDLATSSELANIEADAQAAIDAAQEFARQSPPPTPEEGLVDVYATGSVAATQFFEA